ncbi:MAG: 16S rRNA (cytosine(967)-C(5))-methyltransferase RsmB [Gammaproteobacteria bacterium]|nr:16S rRNA (cytosine(967)-C(5))-methyltransferase RsmB [Gammaproteobacteria bacterium]
MAKGLTARACAARVVTQVLVDGRSLSDVLAAGMERLIRQKERALVQEIVYGVLRWQPRLDVLLGKLLHKPFKKKDRALHSLLLVGLYQLAYMKVASHAVVNETVQVTRELGFSWATKLVNAILRNYQRNRVDLDAELDQDDISCWAHPQWLLQALRKDWPDCWQAIAEANNQYPPMALRVNEQKVAVESYRDKLQQQEVKADLHRYAGQALCLEHALAVESLPGFDQGWVSVQDPAAQIAASLLDVQPGMRVLDACSAPGGKAAHILEQTAGLEQLIALDIDEQRLQRVAQNMQRLQLHAELVVGDAAQIDDWWDGKPFERILLDAPCSATGVIRRHPDIKLLRRRKDIDRLVELQSRILNALWSLLAPGGRLVYATCSVMKAENEEQISGFLSQHADAEEVEFDAQWGQQRLCGRQILPGEEGMDGFYYAAILKTSGRE